MVRPFLAAVLLVGACAGPQRTSEIAPEPRPVLAPPGPEPAAAPRASAEFYRLLKRLEGVGIESLVRDWDWPVRDALPKPERRYGAAMQAPPVLADGWCYGVLVDLDDPRVFWVVKVGSVAGIGKYYGPAEILDDSGPLVLRIGER